MSNLKAKEYKSFEAIKHLSEDGNEFWYAREFAIVLEYVQWRNFAKVLDRAKIACKNSGYAIVDHFAEVSKIVEAGATSKPVIDFKLTRYACYLIVQNGDPRKEVIALGQTYFAIQTRRQEVADYFNQLDEENKRLVIRGDIKQWNQMLAEAAHNAGVMSNEDYATFQNSGYMGLYGGMKVEDIHKKKRLKEKDKILDFMSSTELIANLFRISQTEEKLKKDKTATADAANEIHFIVGREVRGTIKRVGGTMPEDLPTPNKSISDVERSQLKKLKKSPKKLMLDE
ncbi:DNA damage-inducible protein D [candidate division WOR-1 bacterium RIFOXYC2_FULL_37_10]|uniref:DNA damage-inducible protein D n=1 Tax=candidate division WOR-1 bacterium RIFOXYB2_FULL_37_13 TaxID=1802579 RepID=A0A1F4SKK9_UNCSA|nr:MAG: DNA damage-inducible protein D [candidate division WOR-1 bacterium RIFOXYB2_FULL_37_13]OGC37472.1 MAG: DNA damage-inducible protein D [candidate division WOR-1 bacterium RIFOXYC2_FULL_37_10]